MTIGFCTSLILALCLQDPPTFRVQIPSNSPIGKVHKDSDYESHVDTEINIWVPVTNVWGANTLHVESSPDRRDFHPLEARYNLTRPSGDRLQERVR